jgi:S-methylmethionine-dependent homocysteine/selenocysteine methylase
VAAGADVLTTCTFRTARYSLAKAGKDSRFYELVSQAVRLAQSAASTTDRPVWIAGSMAPLGDCFRPEESPNDETLRTEHNLHAQALAAAGVDVLLVETQNSAREAVIAAEAALAMGLPVWVSVGIESREKLLSGDGIAPLANILFTLGISAFLANCLPLTLAEEFYHDLRAQFPDKTLGVYPNLYEQNVTPDEFASWSQTLQAAGANILGGCCFVGPDYIAAAKSKLNTTNF